MSIADHVKGKSTFSFYRAGYLYFKTDTGIEFPIHVDETDGATFTAEEKSIMFMRWIKKALKTNDAKEAGLEEIDQMEAGRKVMDKRKDALSKLSDD